MRVGWFNGIKVGGVHPGHHRQRLRLRVERLRLLQRAGENNRAHDVARRRGGACYAKGVCVPELVRA